MKHPNQILCVVWNKVSANHTLSHYNGGDEFYRLTPDLVYSTGVFELVRHFQCRWLLVDIFTCLIGNKKLIKHDFVVFKLERIEIDGNSFFLTAEDGNNNVLDSLHYTYSDFSADTLSVFFENGTIYLPSER